MIGEKEKRSESYAFFCSCCKYNICELHAFVVIVYSKSYIII